MSKPTIVIVPGVWHTPAHFAACQMHLESAGYKCIGVDLPSNNVPDGAHTLPTIQDDIAAARKIIISELEDRKDVVVVSHSYGSIVATAAIAGLSTSTRQAERQTTSVKRMVIIAGFLVPPNTTMLALMGGSLSPQYLHDKENNTTLPFAGPGVTHVLYNDIEPTVREKAIWMLRPQSYAVNESKTPDQIAALKGIPISYLACEDDNAVPFENQKAMVAGYRNAGVECYAEVAKSGHSPFLKSPEATAKFLRKAAGEEIPTGFRELAA